MERPLRPRSAAPVLKSCLALSAALATAIGCSSPADPVNSTSASPVAAANRTGSTVPPPGANVLVANVPATLTDINLAAADVGGLVESLTGNGSPDLLRSRLIDGVVTPPWKHPQAFGWNPQTWVKFPCDIVFSFFERQTALVGAVTVVIPEIKTAESPDASAAPKNVEIWVSPDGAPDTFRKVGDGTVGEAPGEHQITFPAVEAKFVKLRVVSGASNKELEIAEIRILEAARPGYTALFARAPEVRSWKGSPRAAGQRGLDWLQMAATSWSRTNKCFACHVQSQVLMGQAVALKQGYRVDVAAMRELADLVRSQQLPDGAFPTGWNSYSSHVFGSMGLAHAVAATNAPSDPQLLKAAENLLKTQERDGSVAISSIEPPIIQGYFMTTGNALVAFDWAARHSADQRYGQALDRALSWLSTARAETTQDRVFKIIGLVQFGNAEQRRAAWSAVEELTSQQQPDGGWKESAAMSGSNAFATGQALYAFKQAGISVDSTMFRRGVDYLLNTQTNLPTEANGSWKAINTQSRRKTDFAPTMWAVIGLAGSYGVEPTGTLEVGRRESKIPTRSLEIVLDVSGSMKAQLGTSDRWQTALGVLSEVVTALPEDLQVGLRVYGHRYSSKSAQTCQDTQLLVPLAALDRTKIISAAQALQPRGETPLVRSVLESVNDLKKAGGGSVIVITDGEESCGGNLDAAARQIKASGVQATLSIVGFTLGGKAVEAQLGALASSTGGRYYGAQDGPQLSRAVRLAALQRLPYDVFDTQNKLVASGQTSQLGRELRPGTYRVRIDALGEVLEESVTIVANQTTKLQVALDGDRFVVRR